MDGWQSQFGQMAKHSQEEAERGKKSDMEKVNREEIENGKNEKRKHVGAPKCSKILKQWVFSNVLWFWALESRKVGWLAG